MEQFRNKCRQLLWVVRHLPIVPVAGSELRQMSASESEKSERLASPKLTNKPVTLWRNNIHQRRFYSVQKLPPKTPFYSVENRIIGSPFALRRASSSGLYLQNSTTGSRLLFQGGESLFFGGDLAPSVIRRHPSIHRFYFWCAATRSRPTLLHG
jgi:hypothetical protein